MSAFVWGQNSSSGAVRDSPLSVRYGGSVDGLVASPLSLVLPGEKLSKKERKSNPEFVELGKFNCFTSGFLSRDIFFPATALSRVLTVAPRTALTVSSVTRDPRSYYSILCPVEGCYPTRTIRYYLKVNDKDYVSVWPGQSAVYCGTWDILGMDGSFVTVVCKIVSEMKSRA